MIKDKLAEIIAVAVVIISMLVAGGSSIIKNNNLEMGNTFRPSGIDINLREDLVSGASRSGNTLNVDPIITLDGHRVVMTDIGDIAFGKIDQGNSNEEIVSWTSMTDNTSYYTLTGVEWGYNFYNNATSTGNMKKHNSGAAFIITNDDHWISEQFVNVDDAQTIAGLKTFSVYPESGVGADATTTNQLITYGQTVSFVNQGSATSTYAVGGISRLGTQVEAASSTYSVADPTVLSTQWVTSTPSTLRGLYVPMAENDGYLSQLWLDLTEDYTWTGGHVFNNASSTFTGNLIIGGNSTTTGNVYFGNSLTLNGGFDVSGDLSGNITRLYATDYQDRGWTDSAAEFTIASTTISASDLGTDGIIKYEVYITGIDSSGGPADHRFKVKYGSTVVASSSVSLTSGSETVFLKGELFATGASNTQTGYLETSSFTDSTLDLWNLGTATEDSTGDLELAITAQIEVAQADLTTVFSNFRLIK